MQQLQQEQLLELLSSRLCCLKTLEQVVPVYLRQGLQAAPVVVKTPSALPFLARLHQLKQQQPQHQQRWCQSRPQLGPVNLGWSFHKAVTLPSLRTRLITAMWRS